MKKTYKLFLSLLIMTVAFLGLKNSVYAEDVMIKSTEYLQNIRSLNQSDDTRMYAMATADGRIVFCLKSTSIAPGENNTPNPQKYYYVGENGLTTDVSSKIPGIISIINDSKNNGIMKNNSGQVLSARENYFVTQFALWHYIEGYSGIITGNGVQWIQGSRFSNAFGVLMSNANAASNSGTRNPMVSIISKNGGSLSADMTNVDGTSIKLSNTVFTAKFSQTSNDNQNYSVVLPNSDGVRSYLTNENGSVNYGKEHTFGANEGFRIAVDTSYATDTTTGVSVSFNVSGTNKETKDSLKVYSAYNSNFNFQDVALVSSVNVDLNTSFTVKTTIDKKYDVSIVKVNSKNEKIAGAVIGIYNSNGDKINEVTSTTESVSVSLPTGKYFIKEISAPSGYLLSDNKVEFSIDNSGNVKDSSNNVITTRSLTLLNTLPTIKIEKVNEKKIPVKGAQIVICDYDMNSKKESNCNYKWTTDGTVKELTIGVDFGSIKDGSYIIKEVSAPHGFEISEPKYITVKDGKLYGDLQNNVVTIVDVTYLDVSKTDATGQDEIAGANMKLFDSKGKLVETWVSGTSAHRIKGLDINEVYEIVEELAPQGYVPLSTSIKFRITDEGKVETLDCSSINGNGSGVDTSSCKVMSAEEILKIKNDVTKIKISKVDITNKEEMEGAKLQILNTDGSPVYQDGKILEWISGTEKDENGKPLPHYIEMLPVGDYKLVETFTPAGYAAVSNEVYFSVKPETGIQTVVFENDITKVVISKKDFTNGEEIPGATLQILNPDGTPVIQNGEELKWVSGTTPHEIDMLPVGNYVLVETLPADGYNGDMIIDGMLTSRYEFEVKDSGVLKIDVYNQVIEAPNTGLDVSSTYILGSMVVFIGIGTITFARKKNEI